MNKHQVKGVTNQVTGEIKEQIGRMTGDRATEARGQARQIKGSLQKDLGDAKEAIRQDERALETTRERRREDR